METRTQGSRPRTQKKSEAKAKDSLSEDRQSRGQGQDSSRPRPRTKDTSASALSKKKKVFAKIFQAISKKKGLYKNFLSETTKTSYRLHTWLSVFTARTSKQSLNPFITPYSHLVLHQVCMLLRNVPEVISPMPCKCLQ